MSLAHRDAVIRLAKAGSPKALAQAKAIADPWYRAQALAYVARFMEEPPHSALKRSFAAAASCKDRYRAVAACAWPLRASVERGFTQEAKTEAERLLDALGDVTPPSSRSEAAFLLLQAAFPLGPELRERFASKILRLHTEHWRAARNLVDTVSLLAASDPSLADRLLGAIEDPRTRTKAERAMATPSQPRSFFH